MFMHTHTLRRHVAVAVGALSLIALVAGPSVAASASPSPAVVATVPSAATVVSAATAPTIPLTKGATAGLTVSGVEPGATSVAYQVITVNLNAAGTAPATPPYVWAEPVRDFVRDYDAKHGVDFIVDGSGAPESSNSGASGASGVDGAVGDAYAGLPSDDAGDPANATAGQIADFADQLARFIGGKAGDLGKRGLMSRTAVAGGAAGSASGGAAGGNAAGDVTGGNASDDASDDAGASAGAVVTFAALPPGGHLVLTAGGRYIHRPVIANIAPRYDAAGRRWLIPSRVEAATKRAVPTVDKSINERRDDGHVTGEGVKDAGSDVIAVGDRVTFDLRADVPVFPNNATHRDFTVTDTLSRGLTLAPESIEVFGVGDGETPLDDGRYGLTLGGDAVGTDDVGGAGTGGAGTGDAGGGASGSDVPAAFTFRLDFGGDRYAGVRAYRAIHVRYRAIVNERVVVGPGGNPNDVRLEYSNDPYRDASHGTDDDRVNAFSYGLEVLKTGGDGKPLAGAVFALGGDAAALGGGASGDDSGAVGAYEGVVPVASGEVSGGPSTGSGGSAGESAGSAGPAAGSTAFVPGHYRLPRRDESGAIAAADRARLTRDLAVSDKGELWIVGLRPGDYTLTETKAPEGYVLLGEPVRFTIRDVATAGKSGAGDIAGPAKVEFTGNAVGQRTTGYGYGSVRNYRGSLPRTGSTGVIVLSLAGVLMVLGGLAGLAAASHRRRW